MDAENFIEYFDNSPLLWPVIFLPPRIFKLMSFFVTVYLHVVLLYNVPTFGLSLAGMLFFLLTHRFLMELNEMVGTSALCWRMPSLLLYAQTHQIPTIAPEPAKVRQIMRCIGYGHTNIMDIHK